LSNIRSIDAGWGLDEEIIIPAFCSRGYLYFKDAKIYIYGDKDKSYRAYLTDQDILDLNYGDGIYKFDYYWESTRSYYFWKIKDSRVERSSVFFKDSFNHHFILFLEGDWNVCADFVRNKFKLVNKKNFNEAEARWYKSLVSEVFEEFLGYPIEEEYEQITEPQWDS
jgi:hypothetical protein